MYYVSSVYSAQAASDSYEDELVRERRYLYTMEKVSELMSEGIIAVSPIVHCHEMAGLYSLPKTYEFWAQYNEGLLRACSKVIVLMMPYWEVSKGIAHEIEYATSIGKEIIYVDCGDFVDGCKTTV